MKCMLIVCGLFLVQTSMAVLDASDFPETAIETTPPPDEITQTLESLNDYEQAVFQFSLIYKKVPKKITGFMPKMYTMLKNKHLNDDINKEIMNAFDAKYEIFHFDDHEKARSDLEHALSLIAP